MALEKGPGRNTLYLPTIAIEPCDNGFKASIRRVLLLTTKSPLGVEVPHDPFPPDLAESEERARRLAEERFKVWAAIERLSWSLARKRRRETGPKLSPI